MSFGNVKEAHFTRVQQSGESTTFFLIRTHTHTHTADRLFLNLPVANTQLIKLATKISVQSGWVAAKMQSVSVQLLVAVMWEADTSLVCSFLKCTKH